MLDSLATLLLSRMNMNIADQFFEHTHQPLCVLHFDGRIVVANKAFGTLVGKAADQLEGTALVQLLAPRDAESFELVRQRFSRGLQVEVGLALQRADDVCFAHFTGMPVLAEERVYFVVYDRTDYQRGQVHALIDAAIREEGTARVGQDWLRTLVQRLASVLKVHFALVTTYLETPQGMGDACPFWTGDTFLSDVFRYRLQGTPCGIVARNEVFVARERVQEAFPEDVDLVTMNIQSYLGVPLLDSHGKIFGHVAIMDIKPLEDVALKELGVRIFAGRIAAELERLRMVNEVNESQARYQVLVDHAADALFVLDRNGIVLEANPKARAELQVSIEELVGKSIGSFWDAESAAVFTNDLAALQIGSTIVSDVVVQCKDGTTFPAECRSVVFEHLNKEVVLLIARNMTEKHRIAQAREDALNSMSTPILEIWQGVLTLPLVGTVDPVRANRVMASLLDAIVRTQADVTILDVTGVSEVDASTATHLLDIMRAASLLGTRCLVSGISPKVARTMVDLDVPSNQFRTFGDLAAALKEAIRLRRAA